MKRSLGFSPVCATLSLVLFDKALYESRSVSTEVICRDQIKSSLRTHPALAVTKKRCTVQCYLRRGPGFISKENYPGGASYSRLQVEPVRASPLSRLQHHSNIARRTSSGLDLFCAPFIKASENLLSVRAYTAVPPSLLDGRVLPPLTLGLVSPWSLKSSSSPTPSFWLRRLLLLPSTCALALST